MEEEVGEALLVVLRAVTKLLLVVVVMNGALMGVKEEDTGAGAGAGADEEEEAAEAAFPARDNWPKKSLKFCMARLFVVVWWWWCYEYDCLVV